MNHENAMLSERSQLQKTTYCMVPFMLNVQKGPIHGDREQASGGRGCCGDEGSCRDDDDAPRRPGDGYTAL